MNKCHNNKLYLIDRCKCVCCFFVQVVYYMVTALCEGKKWDVKYKNYMRRNWKELQALAKDRRAYFTIWGGGERGGRQKDEVNL